MFKKLRLKTGNAIMNRKLKKISREKKVHNFRTARTVCLIFDGTNVFEFSYIKKFKEYLESFMLDVYILGFINSEKMPFEYLNLKNSIILNKKDLDLFYRPNKEIRKVFFQKKFDLLLNLCVREYLPVMYFVNLVKSSFKVGRFSENPNDYDLMINLGIDSTVQYLGEQIIHYVDKLNNPTGLFTTLENRI